jgi:hypothetical protein
MKKCSTSLTIMKMQNQNDIEIPIFPQLKWLSLRNKQQQMLVKIGRGKGTFTHYWWECKLV